MITKVFKRVNAFHHNTAKNPAKTKTGHYLFVHPPAKNSPQTASVLALLNLQHLPKYALLLDKLFAGTLLDNFALV